MRPRSTLNPQAAIVLNVCAQTIVRTTLTLTQDPNHPIKNYLRGTRAEAKRVARQLLPPTLKLTGRIANEIEFRSQIKQWIQYYKQQGI